MAKRHKGLTFIGIVIASTIATWLTQKQTDKEIEETVNKALSKKES